MPKIVSESAALNLLENIFFTKAADFTITFFFLVNIILSVNLICLVIFCLYFEVVTQYDVGHLCIFLIKYYISVPIVVLEFPGAYPLFFSFYCDQILTKTV